MSRHERPDIGSELLTAVSASLAVLKTHLTNADPKVSLRAASELTKLLSVCARYDIPIETGNGNAADVGPPPRASRTVGERSHGQIERGENGTPPSSARTKPPAPVVAEGRRPFPAPFGAPPPDRDSALPPGGKRLGSFLGPPVGNVVRSGSG